MLRRLLLVLATLTVLSACAQETSSPGTPTPSATPVERLNTAQMVLPRINFCSLVPDAAVEKVLGTSSFEGSDWDNGDRAPLVEGRSDVVAEHLCEWSTKDGTATARAWVFSRPVDTAFARRVVRAERTRPGCTSPDAPPFGRPSVLQVCSDDTGETRVRRAGLFQDTWFACELSAPGGVADVRSRTDEWCGGLVSQLNTTR